MRQRNGFARLEHGKFETLESRTLLAGHGLICVAPSVVQSSENDAHSPDAYSYDAHSHDAHFHDVHAIDAPTVESASLPSIAQASSVKVGLDRVPVLHSHPMASAKIFLDFTGHIVHGTGWNELNQGASIHAPAFDVDGDAESFDATEIAIIEKVWARVAEDFAPFDVDVTTEAPSTRSLRAGSQAIRVLISSNVDIASGRAWMPAGSGIAYLNSWRSPTDTPVWVFANRLGVSDKNIAESASHEIGHAFGLQHDGRLENTDSVEEYFAGHGDSVTGWAPIMGLGFHRPVTQWNQGEYDQADNDQDDISTIASEQNGIRLRVDDHADLILFATPIASDEGGRVSASGLISTRDDQDAFQLNVGAGSIDLVVSPVSLGANLNIAVSLFDQQGTLVGTFDSDSSLSAHIQVTVAAGTYYLSIDGVGHGDPATSGYSDYGSLGQYTIRGSVAHTGSISLDGGAVVEADRTPSVLAQIRLAAQRLAFADDSESTSESVLAKWLALQSQQSHAIQQIRTAARSSRFS